jgi:hypothetical protein
MNKKLDMEIEKMENWKHWKYYLKIFIDMIKDTSVSETTKLKIKEVINDKDKFIKWYKRFRFRLEKGEEDEDFYRLLDKQTKEDIENESYFHPELSKEIAEQKNKDKEEIQKDIEKLINLDWDEIREMI